MVRFETFSEDQGRPVSEAGVGHTQVAQEEERVEGGAESTPSRTSDRRPGVEEASPSTTISSASESAPPSTARDLRRVKRGVIRATEHLRESLADTKERLWETIDDEVQ